VRVPLRAVADDGHLLALDEGEIRVLVVIDGCHVPSLYLQSRIASLFRQRTRYTEYDTISSSVASISSNVRVFFST
jgi:hypothetical protein